ncbi:MAG: DUF433 domain-containing protein [Acidobacteriaceae bacterium]|nr:DUF433 domain-containing protein [Acidobacteriaceae bacterium]
MPSPSSYVERWGEDYMVGDSRVSLASVVYAWKEGLSPESIQNNFPALSLEQVYGAIAYYLANQTEVDAYLSELNLDFERRRAEQAALYPERMAKLRAALASQS